MAYKYSYNTRDIKFILNEWLPVDEILGFDKFKDYYSKDDFDTIIDQVRKIAADVIAPTAEDGDEIGVRYENGQAHIQNHSTKFTVICRTMAGKQQH